MSAIDDPLELARELGLTDDEYGKLCARIERTPNATEVHMVATAWSERCSYRSSRIHLRSLPCDGPQVLEGLGENAGVVALGGGLAVAFKIESHPRCALVEQAERAAGYALAAAGDILAMGARPVALAARVHLGARAADAKGEARADVAAGLGRAAEMLGVATVAHRAARHQHLGADSLLDVLCVGLVSTRRVVTAGAFGPGSPVLYVSDPSAGERLMTACLEVMAAYQVVAAQDLGAGGLSSAALEMSARANTGMDLHLERIPAQPPTLAAHERLLVETPARMLLVLAVAIIGALAGSLDASEYLARVHE